MFGFLLGFVLGFLLVHSQWLLSFFDVDILSAEEFEQSHPDKRWMLRLMNVNMFIWILIYLLFVFPSAPVFKSSAIFVISFWFVGGMSLLDSLIEIFIGHAPLRIVTAGRGGGGSGVIRVASGKQVRLFGLGQMMLTILVGVVLPFAVKI